MSTLQNKYRPKSWKAVLGQGSIPTSVERALASGECQSFLFTGPSGVGKTTLARLIARDLKCRASNILEIDAASNSGVDAARQLVQNLSFRAMGKRKTRVIIIDECHALTKASWQVLLKAVEEPNAGDYFVFCTTEATKVPKTIVTRCLSYQLKEVPHGKLLDYIKRVSKKEGYAPKDSEILEVLTDAAQGSPRMALSLLGQVLHSDLDEEQARELFSSASNSPDVYKLCKELQRDNPNWKILRSTLTDMKGTAPEGIRRQVLYYFAAIILKESQLDSSSRSVQLIEAFSEPIPEGETTIAPIILAVLNSIL